MENFDGLDKATQNSENASAEDGAAAKHTDAEHLRLIAELRETNSKLKANESFKNFILESSNDCIKVLDLEGRIIYINGSGLKSMKLSDVSQVRGQCWFDFWEEADQKKARQAFQETLAGATGHFTAYLNRGGQQPGRWWNAVLSPIVDENGVQSVLAVSRDVTAEQNAAQELRKNEERMRVVANAIPQLVWTATPDGETDFINGRCSDFTGIQGNGKGIKHWLNALHPDDADRAFGQWRISIESGKVFQCEYRLNSAQGAYRWFLGRAIPIRDEQQNIVQWFGTATDIDDQKNLMSEALQSRDELDVVLRGVTDGIIVMNPRGEFIFTNDVGAKLCGFETAAELLATPVDQIMNSFEILGENGEVFDPQRLPGRLALQGIKNPPEVLVKSRMKKTGLVRWSVVNASPAFDERGNVKYAVSIFRDFTERKAIEDSLHILAQSGVLLSSSLDYKTTLESIAKVVVPSLADWCVIAVKEPGDAAPKTITATHSDPAKMQWALEVGEKYPSDWNSPTGAGNVMRTGKSEIYPEILDEMVEAAAKDANHLSILRALGMKSVLIVPLKARDSILGVMTLISAELGRRYTPADVRIAEDIAIRAGLAVENALLFKKAQQSIEARNEFLSIASHELKTPITSLKLQLQMTKRKIESEGRLPPPERMLKVLDVSLKQINRLTDFVEDMLDVSRIQAGKLSLNAEHFNLSPFVQEICDRFADQFQESHCELVLDLSARAEGFWDRTRIEQVVVNLISNILKYAPGSTVRIALTTSNDGVKLWVRDNGPGIAKDKQATIFNRFERATSSRNISGLGLGLFIVKQIVDAHGGTIELQSSEGQGTSFCVSLPWQTDAKNLAPDFGGEFRRGVAGEHP